MVLGLSYHNRESNGKERGKSSGDWVKVQCYMGFVPTTENQINNSLNGI